MDDDEPYTISFSEEVQSGILRNDSSSMTFYPSNRLIEICISSSFKIKQRSTCLLILVLVPDSFIYGALIFNLK